MVLTKKYQSSQSAIASYNYTDIAAGVGYVSYYGGNVVSGGAILYKLSGNTFYSDRVLTASLVALQSFTKEIDLDFDVLFKQPQTIEGAAICNIPFGIYAQVSASTYNAFAHVRIRKFSGGTETEIANASGAVFTLASTGVNEYKYAMDAITMEIPQTHYKIGDTLRITAELWESGTGTPDGYVFMGHDPRNRATTNKETISLTFGTEPSNLIIQIPFRIDV